jgi:DNA (cytosine-5)-methyltransferase 1
MCAGMPACNSGILKGGMEMFNSIELFCGTGGLALGLHQSGFRHRALFEWDKDSCENIRSNIAAGFPGTRHWDVRQSDVRLVNFSEFGTGIALVSGGPPCQPFSLGGKHKANADYRDMFPEAVRAVRELRPKAFIFENVKGLLRKSFSTYFSYIILQLTYPELIRRDGMDWLGHLQMLEKRHTSGISPGLEYNVVFRLVNAADYGVPQMRYRVVIVGFRNDLDASWSFPDPTHSKDALRFAQEVDGSYWDEHEIAPKHRPQTNLWEKGKVVRLADRQYGLKRWQTVRDAIKDLPAPQSNAAAIAKNHDFRGGARAYAGHSGSALDEPSKTIKAGAHGVPGGENMLVLDDGSLRYYTVRESARIQTFPDEYLFHGSWTESMRQIGNAVPVKLAEIIGGSVIAQLERIEKSDSKRRLYGYLLQNPC